MAFVGIKRGEQAPMSDMKRREFISLLGGALSVFSSSETSPITGCAPEFR